MKKVVPAAVTTSDFTDSDETIFVDVFQSYFRPKIVEKGFSFISLFPQGRNIHNKLFSVCCTKAFIALCLVIVTIQDASDVFIYAGYDEARRISWIFLSMGIPLSIIIGSLLNIPLLMLSFRSLPFLLSLINSVSLTLYGMFILPELELTIIWCLRGIFVFILGVLMDNLENPFRKMVWPLFSPGILAFFTIGLGLFFQWFKVEDVKINIFGANIRLMPRTYCSLFNLTILCLRYSYHAIFYSDRLILLPVKSIVLPRPVAESLLKAFNSNENLISNFNAKSGKYVSSNLSAALSSRVAVVSHVLRSKNNSNQKRFSSKPGIMNKNTSAGKDDFVLFLIPYFTPVIIENRPFLHRMGYFGFMSGAFYKFNRSDIFVLSICLIWPTAFIMALAALFGNIENYIPQSLIVLGLFLTSFRIPEVNHMFLSILIHSFTTWYIGGTVLLSAVSGFYIMSNTSSGLLWILTLTSIFPFAMTSEVPGAYSRAPKISYLLSYAIFYTVSLVSVTYSLFPCISDKVVLVLGQKVSMLQISSSSLMVTTFFFVRSAIFACVYPTLTIIEEIERVSLAKSKTNQVRKSFHALNNVPPITTENN